MLSRNRLVAVWQWSWAQRLLLAEACWSLGMARCAVNLLPFRRLTTGLGTPMQESPHTDGGLGHMRVTQVGWAVSAVSRRLPWTSQCLVQALAAKWMLQRRQIPSTLYFGIAKDATGQIMAHAWLRSGSQVVTGAQGRQQFTVVATFAESP